MSGKVRYENNAMGHTTAATGPTSTIIPMDDVTLFPVLSPGDFFFVSLGLEVVKVIEVVGNDFTLDPATLLLLNHMSNTVVELRITKQLLDAAGDMGEF